MKLPTQKNVIESAKKQAGDWFCDLTFIVPADVESGPYGWFSDATSGIGFDDYYTDAGLPTTDDLDDDDNKFNIERAEKLHDLFAKTFDEKCDELAVKKRTALRAEVLEVGFVAQYEIPGSSQFQYEIFDNEEEAYAWVKKTWDNNYRGQGAPYTAVRHYADVCNDDT